MPIIIGYMIGKMIGNLIVSIITLMFRLIKLACIVAIFILRHTFAATQWVLVKLWDGGRSLYENYKLNLR